jgi:hypothetical protein
MADVKISALPQDSSPTVTDKIPSVDTETGLTKRITLSDLITLFFNNAPSTSALGAIGQKNLMINGNFDVWQRGTSFAAVTDDTYGVDRWNHLCEANGAWNFAQDTDVPTAASKFSLKMTNVTANQQGGLVYFMEGKDAAQLINQNVSLSFWAKTSTTEIAKLRCAILSWNGTEDTITSDVVGTWAQNGTNPTWATNWTAENTPSDLSLTASWQKFSIENIPIDTSGMKNVAVVVWIDDGTITAGDRVWLSQFNLVVSPKVLPIMPTRYADELSACKRYYQKYVEPHMMGVMSSGSSTGFSRLGLHLSTEMRVAPTASVGALPLFDTAGITTLASVTVSYHSKDRFQIDGTTAAALTTSRPLIAYKLNDTATLVLDAEL